MPVVRSYTLHAAHDKYLSVLKLYTCVASCAPLRVAVEVKQAQKYGVLASRELCPV